SVSVTTSVSVSVADAAARVAAEPGARMTAQVAQVGVLAAQIAAGLPARELSGRDRAGLCRRSIDRGCVAGRALAAVHCSAGPVLVTQAPATYPAKATRPAAPGATGAEGAMARPAAATITAASITVAEAVMPQSVPCEHPEQMALKHRGLLVGGADVVLGVVSIRNRGRHEFAACRVVIGRCGPRNGVELCPGVRCCSQPQSEGCQ